LTVHFV
jgi:hypothetical protein